MVREPWLKAHQLREASAAADSTGDSTAGKCPKSMSDRWAISITKFVGPLCLPIIDVASKPKPEVAEPITILYVWSSQLILRRYCDREAGG